MADCARTSMYKIVHVILSFCKLANCWIPRLLTEDDKKSRMCAALEFLQAYEREGSSLIVCIVTGDETWVHHSTLESKQQNMAWCEPVNLHPKKRKWVTLPIRLWRQFFGMPKAFSSSNTIQEVVMWINKRIRWPWRNYVLPFASCARDYEVTKSFLSTIMPDRIRRHPFKNSFTHFIGIFSGIQPIHQTSHPATSCFLSWGENLGLNVSGAMKKSNVQLIRFCENRVLLYGFGGDCKTLL